MKRIFLALSLLLAASLSSFATETTVSGAIIHSFEASFAGAKNVKWSQTEEFYVAEFTLQNKVQYAYYRFTGELAVVARPLSLSDLGDAQKVSLYKQYEDYTITDIYELEDTDATRTFVVLENAGRKLFLSASGKKWKVEKIRNK